MSIERIHLPPLHHPERDRVPTVITDHGGNIGLQSVQVLEGYPGRTPYSRNDLRDKLEGWLQGGEEERTDGDSIEDATMIMLYAIHKVEQEMVELINESNVTYGGEPVAIVHCITTWDKISAALKALVNGKFRERVQKDHARGNKHFVNVEEEKLLLLQQLTYTIRNAKTLSQMDLLYKKETLVGARKKK